MVSLAGNEPNDGDAISISKTSEELSIQGKYITQRASKVLQAAARSTAEIQLAKTDLTAQAVNLKYNELNKFLLAEVKWAEQKVRTSTCSNVMLLQGIFFLLLLMYAC